MADTPKYGAQYDGTDVRTGKAFTFDGGYYYDQPLPTGPTLLIMNTTHLSRAFARLGDDPLVDFALNVSGHFKDNAALTNPTVSDADMKVAADLLHNAIVAVPTGGHPAVILKLSLRADLILKLRLDAKFVEEKPGMTDAIAVTSGYKLIEPSTHTPKMPSVPSILKVTNVASHKFGLVIDGDHRAIYFEFRGTLDGIKYVLLGTSTSTRDIVLEDLESGKLYTLQARACAGGKLFSEWSDPITHMCT